MQTGVFCRSRDVLYRPTGRRVSPRPQLRSRPSALLSCRRPSSHARRRGHQKSARVESSGSQDSSRGRRKARGQSSTARTHAQWPIFETRQPHTNHPTPSFHLSPQDTFANSGYQNPAHTHHVRTDRHPSNRRRGDDERRQRQPAKRDENESSNWRIGKAVALRREAAIVDGLGAFGLGETDWDVYAFPKRRQADRRNS